MVMLLRECEQRAQLMSINDWEAENWLGQRCSKIPIWSLGLQQDWVRWPRFLCGNSESLEFVIFIRQAWLNV